MDRRIRQNGLAHSPKWTSACMIHYTCVYIRVGWRLLRRGPLGFPPQGGSRAAKASSPLEYIHMYSVSCMRWSILANAPIHFGECAYPFYRMRQSILANIRFQGTLDILHFQDTLSFFIIFIYSRVWISCGIILWQCFDYSGPTVNLHALQAICRVFDGSPPSVWKRDGQV